MKDGIQSGREGFEGARVASALRGRLVLPFASPLLCVLLLMGMAGVAGAAEQVSNIRSDQEVLFYPSTAYSLGAGKIWTVDIHGCVYEPEKRTLAIAALKRSLGVYGIRMTPAEEKELTNRARLFMVDNQRGREVVVGIGNQVFKMGKSAPNGHFTGTAELTAQALTNLGAFATGKIEIRAVLPSQDRRTFAGEVRLVRDSGVIVVSDVDDTIKITHVTNPQLMLRTTFLEPFRPVPGMADTYQNWAKNPEVRFCYVSASPWQLFLPLSEFVRSNGYPAGIFWLKEVRFKDKTVMRLFDSPEKFKPGIIEPLIQKYPKSQFVLVGDSGEKDPEIYAALARKYPTRVAQIFIRDVTGQSATSERYRQAFNKIPAAKWTIFNKASELPDAISTKNR